MTFKFKILTKQESYLLNNTNLLLGSIAIFGYLLFTKSCYKPLEQQINI